MKTGLRPLVFALMTTLNLLGLTVITASTGCKGATIIGTSCKSNGDCNVTGQVCAPGFDNQPSICTRVCNGNTGAMGCPIGYDCFPTDPSKGSTCNQVLYNIDVAGNPSLIGIDCSKDDGICVAVPGQTNAMPSCRKVFDTSQDPPVPVDSDPNAYCTGVCGSDGDCPLDFECATDLDGLKKCLRRTLCDECTIDANCSKDFPQCVASTNNTGRYCTKECSNENDCGGVQNTYMLCAPTLNAAGSSVNVCIHRYGGCVGDGNICDPCRTKADCAKSGGGCITNIATGESFCTKQCSDDSDCGGAGAGKVASTCDNTDEASNANPEGMSIDICNGDTGHEQPGLESCYLSPP